MAKRVAATGPVDGPWALPDGWRWERLGNILPLSYGKALKATERLGGDVPVYGSAGVTGFHNEALCEEPALIVGRKGSAGTVYHSACPFYAIDTTYYCARSSAEIDLRLAFHLLTFLNLRKLDQSTAVPSLSRDPYNELIVPVPPDAMQPILSARIDELFAEVDDGEAVLARARDDLATWRKALLKAAVTGELTADWRDTDSASETGADLLAQIIAARSQRGDAHLKRGDRQYLSSADVTADGRASLPDGWVWARIGDLFEVFVGATPSRSDRSLWDGDVPWVSSGEVGFCRISDTREKINRAALRGSTSRLHPPGTVMLGMIGEGKTRGQAAILDIEAAHNQNCASIRVSHTSIPPEYVYLVLAEQYERTRLSSSGGNQPALNKERVKAICIPLPGASECRAIAAIYDEASDAIDAFEAERVLIDSSVATLRQSILAAAFRGDLA